MNERAKESHFSRPFLAAGNLGVFEQERLSVRLPRIASLRVSVGREALTVYLMAVIGGLTRSRFRSRSRHRSFNLFPVYRTCTPLPSLRYPCHVGSRIRNGTVFDMRF